MRMLVCALAASLLVALAGHGLGTAAVDATASGPRPMELVVFEHPDCMSCLAFRSRIAPRYQASPQAAEAPLRFVDIAKTDADRLALKSPITMVPTAVLMREGREVGRIVGYWSPDNFFKMVAYLVGRAE